MSTGRLLAVGWSLAVLLPGPAIAESCTSSFGVTECTGGNEQLPDGGDVSDDYEFSVDAAADEPRFGLVGGDAAPGGNGGNVEGSISVEVNAAAWQTGAYSFGGSGGEGGGTGGSSGPVVFSTSASSSIGDSANVESQGGTGGSDGGDGGDAGPIDLSLAGEAPWVEVLSRGGRGGSRGGDGGDGDDIGAEISGTLGTVIISSRGGAVEVASGDPVGTPGYGGDVDVVITGTVDFLGADSQDGATGDDEASTGGAVRVYLDDGAVVTGMIATYPHSQSSLIFRFNIEDAAEYQRASAAIASADASSGTVVIEGQSYTWEGFDELVNLLFLATQPTVNNPGTYEPISIVFNPIAAGTKQAPTVEPGTATSVIKSLEGAPGKFHEALAERGNVLHVGWGYDDSRERLVENFGKTYYQPIDTFAFEVAGQTMSLSAYPNVSDKGTKIAADGPFQCTGLIADYLALLGLPRARGNGVAVASALARGENKASFQYSDDGVNPPQVGSIISMKTNAAGVGHVAIAKAVTRTSATTIEVTLIEQNATVKGSNGFYVDRKITFVLGGDGRWTGTHQFGKGTYDVADWVTPIRLPST